MSEESMIERVAMAIAARSYSMTGEPMADWHDAESIARAAIEALREQTLVYRDNGRVVHEMRGAPDDIWKTLLYKALT